MRRSPARPFTDMTMPASIAQAGPSVRAASAAIAAGARPDGRARVSFGQLRIWFLQQLDPRSTAYHVHTARRITGPLRVDAFERALNAVVRRHEALRTTFALEGSEP